MRSVVWKHVLHSSARLPLVLGDRHRRHIAFAVTPVGAEFQINTFTAPIRPGPQVGMSSTGSFVVVWSSDGQDNLPDYSFDGVFGRATTAPGAAIAGEFQVNSYTSGTRT